MPRSIAVSKLHEAKSPLACRASSEKEKLRVSDSVHFRRWLRTRYGYDVLTRREHLKIAILGRPRLVLGESRRTLCDRLHGAKSVADRNRAVYIECRTSARGRSDIKRFYRVFVEQLTKIDGPT
jgi:hypothetical protein